ncbi:MAG TPA: ChbG/HpnK family deacetylase [Ignavibacteriaceae bacterium]|nr:ChbG/HpnK family deacetylase [Ignavibacteriaceae bacterium]
MKKLFLLLLFLTSTIMYSQENQKQLLIRMDDLGMSHSVNMAFEKVFKTGIPVSASVMFACPWYQEAVDILKKYPNVAVGIHLTLNAEWKNYKWGPITYAKTLTDKNGFFLPSRKLLFENNPSTEEVEKELRAQIERALNSGIKISYLDHHMGTVVDKPQWRELLERLAKEYKLGISRYFGEYYMDNMYSKPIESKKDSLVKILNNDLKDGQINLLVCHIGTDNDELAAMLDENTFGLKEMSKHRQAELNALISDDIQKMIHSPNIKLINYEMLVKDGGYKNIKRPVE